MTLSDIRKSARETLAGKWNAAALLTFVFYLVSFGISILYVILSYIPLVSFVAMIGFYAVTFPMVYGLSFCFMEMKKNNNVDCADFLTLGFSNFGKIWCIIGNIFKKTWLYLLLYFVLIFATAFLGIFTIIFSIALESPFFALFSCLLIFILIAAIITIYILFIIKLLLYSLSMYIAWDNPNMSAKDAVKTSEQLMKGHRGKYFLLYLSFIGWNILSIFTLGIGMLWLLPYMEMSSIIFYENRIKKNINNENTEEIKDTTSEHITEIKEENIKKIDILDDEGNIIK